MQVQEQLASLNLPSQAVETTNAVSGAIVLGPTGQVVSGQSKIVANLSTLHSDKPQRDNFIQHRTLDTAQFPDATFVPTSISGLPAPLPTSGQASFKLLGNMTVHGVTKPFTWDVTAQFTPSGVNGKATSPFTITEFGMQPPKAGPVLSVKDGGTIILSFSASRSAA